MKILDIAFKDLLRSTRNFFLIGMTLVAPLFITGLIYFAFGGLQSGNVSMTAIKVGVVNADTLTADAPLEVPIGKNIRDMFFDDSVKSWITASDYPDEASARTALESQEIGVAVIIPQAFTEKLLAGQTDTPILLLQDPTLTIAPGVVRDMVTSLLDGVAGGGIAFRVISERLQANGLTLDSASLPGLLERYSTWYAGFQRAFFHTPQNAVLVLTSPVESGNSFQAMMGLVMAGQLIFFSFFTGAFSMMTFLQEDEEGTLARLFTTPTRRTLILTGKFLAVFLAVVIQGLVLLIIGHLLFGVHWGKPGSFILSLLGQAIAAVGLSVLLISLVKTSKQAGPVLGGGLTFLGMLSGLFTTNVKMPAAFNAIGNFTPQGWVLKAWKLTLSGAPLSQLLLPFLVLLAMGVVMFLIGAVLFRRRYA